MDSSQAGGCRLTEFPISFVAYLSHRSGSIRCRFSFFLSKDGGLDGGHLDSGLMAGGCSTFFGETPSGIPQPPSPSDPDEVLRGFFVISFLSTTTGSDRRVWAVGCEGGPLSHGERPTCAVGWVFIAGRLGVTWGLGRRRI